MNEEKYYTLDALEYISKLSDGGLRDSLTMLDKCISYSTEITLENVVKALGSANFDTMFDLCEAVFSSDFKKIIYIVESLHKSGLDLKQFMKQFMFFILDVVKYDILESFELLSIPSTYETELKSYGEYEFDTCLELLTELVQLNSAIKWETSPKAMIEVSLITFVDNKEIK